MAVVYVDVHQGAAHLNTGQNQSINFHFSPHPPLTVVYFDQRSGAAHSKRWSK